MSRIAEILARHRDDWNAEAERWLEKAADAEPLHPEHAAFCRQQAEEYRLMAWDAHGELVNLNTDREAA